jgi:hypothetical protein
VRLGKGIDNAMYKALLLKDREFSFNQGAMILNKYRNYFASEHPQTCESLLTLTKGQWLINYEKLCDRLPDGRKRVFMQREKPVKNDQSESHIST